MKIHDGYGDLKKMNRIYVLDTNVILYDHNCIDSFHDDDVVIPITVLEEIDGFKHGKDQIHYNAREFIRTVDGLSGDKLVREGVSLGTGKGNIRIMTNHQHEPEVDQVFSSQKIDHRILSVALYLTKTHTDRSVVFITKDVNLRLKAKSLGIRAQDYHADRIHDIRNQYRGKRLISDVDSRIIDELFGSSASVEPSCLGLENPVANEYLVLKNGTKSSLAFFNAETQRIQRVDKNRAYGISPRNAEQTFALHALMNPNILLVTLAGKAGTGKTLIALAASLEMQRSYHQIYLARPIVPLSNKDLGYLPGDLNTKLDPYMQPLYDNLSVIRNQFQESDKPHKRIGEMLEKEKLFITPLAYIRGRHLEKIFFIVDEAQNLTPHEVKTIITRAGEGTKIVFTGDPHQIDTPYLDALSNGLTYLIDRMKGQPLYAHVTLEKGERSCLAELASNLL
ncbi:MAG: PhoH family protein [Desulfobacteraceae bacterium]|jgi:PhoH-like ATPase|nr:MAG: PhoH family protein [Desulfobacteraceae bacterium]